MNFLFQMLRFYNFFRFYYLAEDVISLQRNVLGYLRCVIKWWSSFVLMTLDFLIKQKFRDIEKTLKIVSLESHLIQQLTILVEIPV